MHWQYVSFHFTLILDCFFIGYLSLFVLSSLEWAESIYFLWMHNKRMTILLCTCYVAPKIPINLNNKPKIEITENEIKSSSLDLDWKFHFKHLERPNVIDRIQMHWRMHYVWNGTFFLISKKSLVWYFSEGKYIRNINICSKCMLTTPDAVAPQSTEL